MTFIDGIKQRAKENIKTIILTESEDVRVLKAAEKVKKKNTPILFLLEMKQMQINLQKKII